MVIFVQQPHIQKEYGLDVSAKMVTRITDKILPIAKKWQNRQLNELYPIIYLNGIVFNVNKDGHIIKKTAYLVFAITIEGKKDILGIRIGEAESSKFWMTVLPDLKNREIPSGCSPPSSRWIFPPFIGSSPHKCD